MEAQLTTTTESVRVDKELLAKIRHISKKRGQTIAGYINVNLEKIVERDWQKLDAQNRL
jgi:predicted DNA-binding protein